MAPTGSTIYLVSCVGQKRAEACPARDLYISDWFLKARQYAEGSGCRWYILSAEHGLVAPNQLIAPYERTLNLMPIAERRAWAKRVADQLATTVPELRKAVFLAGAAYREFLADQLTVRGVSVSVPMEGLGIGKQLQWLVKHAPPASTAPTAPSEFQVKMNKLVYIGDSGDVVKRIRTNHCSGNVEGSAFRLHVAAAMGFTTIRTKRPSGATKVRLDLLDPLGGERAITQYARSGVWRVLLCDSYHEAHDFQWYAIDDLKPALNRDFRAWEQANRERYAQLLQVLLESNAVPYNRLPELRSGPGVYAFYHDRLPEQFHTS